jgi:small subunit ribosomal protein S13
MARVANVDIPDNKRIEIALTRIYGIGPTVAKRITESASVVGNPKTGDLGDQEMTRIREVVDRDYMVEGDLRREVNENIRRLIDIGSYRGIRHRRGLPVHGQRTKTNSRTKRAGRRTVAGTRKVMKK